MYAVIMRPLDAPDATVTLRPLLELGDSVGMRIHNDRVYFELTLENGGEKDIELLITDFAKAFDPESKLKQFFEGVATLAWREVLTMSFLTPRILEDRQWLAQSFGCLGSKQKFNAIADSLRKVIKEKAKEYKDEKK